MFLPPCYKFYKIKCEPGTRFCLTKTNKKVNEEDRITAVIPIAQMSTLEPKYNTSLCAYIHDFHTESPNIRLPAPKFISLFLNGPDYPSPSTSLSKHQSLNLTVICHPLEVTDPKFVSYDGSRLNVEWTGSAGCPLEGGNKDDDKKDDKKEEDKLPDHESIGSGLGWFSLAYVIYSNFESFRLKFYSIFLSLAAYFGLGAYHNYSTYGARGADLIP